MLEELRTILFKHKERYPHLTTLDLVKLVYQNEFGSGHFIADEAAALARLEKEVTALEHNATLELFETIGNGLVRLNLAALGDALPLRLVNRFFVLTAQKVQGRERQFEQKLQLLGEISQDSELEPYLEEYKTAGYPPVSHSAEYREHYAPSYRVVSSKFALYFPIFRELEKRMQYKKTLVVGIDGRSGSGKSSLAKLLQDVYRCPVISMDHFFLRPEQRSENRLQEPGGNVDYERFEQEVSPNLKTGETFTYQIYDCQTNDLTISSTIKPESLVVVEGSYSHHPVLRQGYDLKVFLTVSPETQQNRLLKRNGSVMLQRFLTEWIPLEERYFSSFNIPEQSDLILSTEDKNSFFGHSGFE